MDWRVLRTKLATLGPHQILGHYAYRGLNRLFPLDLVRAFSLIPKDVRSIARPPDVRCEQLDEARLRREAETPDRCLSISDVESCLARGEDCFGVIVAGALASYAWYTSRTARLRPGINVRFDPRYAYSRWAFTLPEYRGRGLHAIGKAYALEHYVAAGRTGVLATVNIANFESLNSAVRLGSRPVGLMMAAQLGGRSLLWASAGCRPYGFALEAERPALP
jgi:hypothetical protein